MHLLILPFVLAGLIAKITNKKFSQKDIGIQHLSKDEIEFNDIVKAFNNQTVSEGTWSEIKNADIKTQEESRIRG